MEMGGEPSIDDLAEATGLPLQQVQEALGAAAASVSLNIGIGEYPEVELIDIIADPNVVAPEEEAQRNALLAAMRVGVNRLSDNEKKVIQLRFGFDCKPHTLDQTAKELKLTRERVRQIENTAMYRLSKMPEIRGMET